MALDPTIVFQQKLPAQFRAERLANEEKKQNMEFNQQAMPLKLEAARNELAAAPIEQEAKKLAVVKDKLTLAAQLLGSSVDQASYDMNRNKAIQMGIVQPDEMPPVFNPEQINRMNEGVLTALQKHEMQMRQFDMQLKQQDYAEKVRHNKAMEQGRFEIIGSDESGNPIYGPPNKGGAYSTGNPIFDKARAAIDAKTLKDAAEASTSAEDTIGFGNAFLKAQKGVGMQGPLEGLLPSISASAGAADTASTELALGFVEKTKGAISNAEMSLFKGASPSLTKTEEANEAIIKNMQAAANRKREQSSFLDAYSQVYGTLSGANEAWSKYINENPLFDTSVALEKQQPKETKSWEEYLQYGPRTAGQGKDGVGGDAPKASGTIYKLNDLKELSKKQGVPLEVITNGILKRGGKIE